MVEAKKRARLLRLIATTKTQVGPIATLAPTRPSLFMEWAASVLGVSRDTTLGDLVDGLIAGKHTLTDDEALDLAQRTDQGEATKMSAGHANFYFKINMHGGVSVGYVISGGRWASYEHLLV
ncbi:MAG: hypothetical protein AAB737_04680, partial [Patescibacteria group bacterium]